MARNSCFCRRLPTEYYNAQTVLGYAPEEVLTDFNPPMPTECYDMLAATSLWSLAFMNLFWPRVGDPECRRPTSAEVEQAIRCISIDAILRKCVRIPGVALPEEQCASLDTGAI